MRGDHRASGGGRCSSIFCRRQQIIGRKWPVIYWALYLFRGGADTFAAAASPSAWALKWQSAGAQSRKEMASLWLRLKANKWVQLFLARTHWSSLSWQSIPHIVHRVRMRERAFWAQKDCHTLIAQHQQSLHYPYPMILIAFSGINFIPAK